METGSEAKSRPVSKISDPIIVFGDVSTICDYFCEHDLGEIHDVSNILNHFFYYIMHRKSERDTKLESLVPLEKSHHKLVETDHRLVVVLLQRNKVYRLDEDKLFGPPVVDLRYLARVRNDPRTGGKIKVDHGTFYLTPHFPSITHCAKK